MTGSTSMPVPTDTIDVTLSADEWALISALRSLPESPLRVRVGRLLDTLLTFIAEPRCAEMQADGVPCNTVDAQCEQCVHVAEMIERLAHGPMRQVREARTDA